MLKDRILERIRTNGPISFEAYMEACLYDPEHGFFSAGDLRPGTGGDFITSPEVSPWFGRLIGRWAKPLIRDDSIVVEIGAGRGSLLAPMIDEAGVDTRRVYAVERSAASRDALGVLLPDGNVVDHIEALPAAGHAIVVLNEVLDNVPC